ncbi:agmatinase [Rhodovibrionaceae bacterium A322]
MSRLTVDGGITREELKGAEPENTFSGVLSYLRRKYSKDLTGAEVAIAGIPYDLAVTNRPGTRFGPRGIRAASANMAWERPYGLPFNPLEELAIVDHGDADLDMHHPHLVPDQIADHAREILKHDVTMVSLGGDHFITYPLLQAHAEKHGELALLHFDAHTDTWEGEEDDINHGTMFWHAARKGLVDPASSIQVGIRTHNPDEMGFEVLGAPKFHAQGVQATIEQIRKRIGDRKVYLTFDIDCLDPAFAPGTGTPVSGGLTSADALAILRGLQGLNFVGMDLVEVAPAYDIGEITSLAASHLVFEFLALIATRPGGPCAG